jgi:hypothetical protein
MNALSPHTPRIYSFGHSNHTADKFFELMARYGIRAIVDVRSIPSSGRFPQFKKRSLETLSRGHGISYRHCPELGNKVGGIAHLLCQPEGEAAMMQLVQAARDAAPGPAWADGRPPGGATAYMCAEADWRDCHRQVIAQQLLAVFSITTIHILRNGSTESHPSDHVLPPVYGVMPGAQASCCNEPEVSLAGQMTDMRISSSRENEETALQTAPLQRTDHDNVRAEPEGVQTIQRVSDRSINENTTEASVTVQSTQSAEETGSSQPTRTRRWGKKQ